MPKVAMKKALALRQDDACALSGAELGEDTARFDTHRRPAKAIGGTYADLDNVVAVIPTAHMAEHGTLRSRSEALEVLKDIFDDRVQTMKLMLKINNQILAYQRRVDRRLESTEAFLKAQLPAVEDHLNVITKQLTKAVKAYPDTLSRAALKVRGLGPVTVAALAVYVDLGGIYSLEDRAVKDGYKRVGQEKAPTPSSLWRYAGLDKSAGERFEKGVAGGGNRVLRTVLYNAACVMVKLPASPYRAVYDRTKARLEVSQRVVRTRNTQGRMVELQWRETKPCHRHGAALRAVMKHLLADYWLVGRTLYGLPTRPLYAEAMLGDDSIISPRERGWEY